MAAAIPGDERVPTLIRLGVCRQENCPRKGSFGLLGCRCRGNGRYNLRSGGHVYKEIRTRSERRTYNLLNVSRFVGVCSTEDCLSVGNLNEECILCQESGRYGTYVSFDDNEYMIPLLPFYVSGASDRNIIPLRGVYGPCLLYTSPSPRDS